MAKIIVKSSYYKPNSKRSAAGFIRYISTRDGVEKIDESKKYLPAAKKTQQIISFTFMYNLRTFMTMNITT